MKEGGTVGDREERRERKSRDGGETEGLSERDLRRIMMRRSGDYQNHKQLLRPVGLGQSKPVGQNQPRPLSLSLPLSSALCCEDLQRASEAAAGVRES